VTPPPGSGPRFTKPSTRTLVFWGTLAILNLAAGTIASSLPGRLFDFDLMMAWGRYWLIQGANVYAPGPWGNVDYPPNAVVLLSPLAAVL
jgi:hypothetical protein